MFLSRRGTTRWILVDLYMYRGAEVPRDYCEERAAAAAAAQRFARSDLGELGSKESLI